MSATERPCSKCGGPLDARADHGRCRPCVNKYHREWRAKNKPAHRASVDRYRASEKGRTTAKASYLRLKYDLDVSAYDALHEAQGGACAICARSFDEKLVPCVDHNHETGAVRGLLCRACNASIGSLRDDVAMLVRAIAYLQRNERGILIHPLSLIGSAPESREFYADPDAEAHFPDIQEGARINAFVTVDSGTARPTTIGAGTLAMVHCHFGHDAVVGADCEFAPHASVGGWCEIGDNVRVGMGATIRNRVKVGDGARIGMGAVVVKDVPAGAVVVGNPARPIASDIEPNYDGYIIPPEVEAEIEARKEQWDVDLPE